MKKLALGTALSALMLSAALAQAPAPSTSAPSATPNPPASSSTIAPAATTAPGAMNFVTSQQPDQLLASKFKGTDVIGADNAKIGSVSDMLFDKDGKIEAYVVSVGGFLGVGAKDVAIAPSAFQLVKGTNNEADKLKLSATKDQLKQAQNFEPYNPPRTTTGAGGSMGRGMAPSTNTAPSGSR